MSNILKMGFHAYKDGKISLSTLDEEYTSDRSNSSTTTASTR
jgi:hypothetical protein